MSEQIEKLEEEIIDREFLEQCVNKMEPEIQQIFYRTYGENLEKNVPFNNYSVKRMLQSICKKQNLTTQEKKVVLMRFGIVTGIPITLQEVADNMGMTREKARLIEIKALRPPCVFSGRKKLMECLKGEK